MCQGVTVKAHAAVVRKERWIRSLDGGEGSWTDRFRAPGSRTRIEQQYSVFGAHDERSNIHDPSAVFGEVVAVRSKFRGVLRGNAGRSSEYQLAIVDRQNFNRANEHIDRPINSLTASLRQGKIRHLDQASSGIETNAGPGFTNREIPWTQTQCGPASA